MAMASARRHCHFPFPELRLQFGNEVLPGALAPCDLDNDGLDELVVGDIHGQLAVFKGVHDTAPWLQCSGLGCIACCGAADFLWPGRVSLAVVTSEGWLHIFHLPSGSHVEKPVSPRQSLSAFRLHTCRMPLNCCALLARRTPDGERGELILGASDGTVYSFQLEHTCPRPLADSRPSPGAHGLPGLQLRLEVQWSLMKENGANVPIRCFFSQTAVMPYAVPTHAPASVEQPAGARSAAATAELSAQPQDGAERRPLCCCVQVRAGGYTELHYPLAGSGRCAQALLVHLSAVDKPLHETFFF
eukprot:COSAG05_NODE_923_length_6573_cov_168.011725_7_plen_302_part_00